MSAKYKTVCKNRIRAHHRKEHAAFKKHHAAGLRKIKRLHKRCKGIAGSGWFGNAWRSVKGWFGGHARKAKEAAVREAKRIAALAAARVREKADQYVAHGKERISHHYQRGREYVNGKVDAAERKADELLKKKKKHGGTYIGGGN